MAKLVPHSVHRIKPESVEELLIGKEGATVSLTVEVDARAIGRRLGIAGTQDLGRRVRAAGRTGDGVLGVTVEVEVAETLPSCT